MKNKGKIFLFLVSCFFIAVANQNCGEQSSFSLNELASNHSPSILDVDQPESRARVGDRIFIASVFAEVFLPQGANLNEVQAVSRAGKKAFHLKDYVTSLYNIRLDQGVLDTISELILENVEDFQGPCSFVEADATCAVSGDTNARRLEASANTVPAGSVTREGYRLSACNALLDDDHAVSNMIYNIKGKRSGRFVEADIIAVYDLFYPGQPIDEEAYEALVQVYESSKNEKALDVWRAVALPVCQSSGWQIP